MPTPHDERFTRTVSDRGQVTIPKEIREAHGFVSGTDVNIHVENGRVIIEHDDLDDLLAEGYQARKQHTEELNKQWETTSKETDNYW